METYLSAKIAYVALEPELVQTSKSTIFVNGAVSGSTCHSRRVPLPCIHGHHPHMHLGGEHNAMRYPTIRDEMTGGRTNYNDSSRKVTNVIDLN